MGLQVARCLCFFGFLRSGEVVIPTEASFDPSQHLTFNDVSVDNRERPSYLKVIIKHTKTGPFRKWVDIVIGRAEGPLCPVAAILAYMALRGAGPGPLFGFKDGRPLTQQCPEGYSYTVGMQRFPICPWSLLVNFEHCMLMLLLQHQCENCVPHSSQSTGLAPTVLPWGL